MTNDPKNGDGKSSVLAVHSGALGDVILFGQLLSRIPGRVTIVTGREKGELLVGLGAAARAMDFDALPMHEVFGEGESDVPTAGYLPALLGRHDRLISCFAAGDRRAELRLAALAGVGNAAFLPVRPPEGSPAHLLEVWGELLGLSATDSTPPVWPVPQPWRQEAASCLGELGIRPRTPYAVIHPGAGARQKRWPLARFIALAQRLAAEGAEAKLVFVIGPVEREQWPEPQRQQLGGEFPTLLCPSLAVLAGVLAGAQEYIGNDSGASHLAAAIGTPTLALFAPTNPKNFAPIGPCVRVIAVHSWDNLSVEQVWDVWRENSTKRKLS